MSDNTQAAADAAASTPIDPSTATNDPSVQMATVPNDIGSMLKPSTILSNTMYDRLRWVAQYLLPAVGTLYFALAQIWGFSDGEQIVGTITAVDAFLGVILGFSSMQYTKGGGDVDGILHVTPDRETYAAIETPTADLVDKGTMTLKVKAVGENTVSE